MKSFLFLSPLLLVSGSPEARVQEEHNRPHILFAISDDQSFAHTSFAGCTFVNTPAFDRVARSGVCFTNCFAGSPGCAPSRSSIVTGRYHWQNEQSGQHASSWMKKYVPFVDLIEANGYHTGRTGKGAGPFQYARTAADSLWRKGDAAGITRSDIRYKAGQPGDERFASGIGTVDYFANFRYFMEHRPADKPFFFWYGATEPHRDYEKESWKRHGKKLSDVQVPAFLPDDGVIRGDLLDYAVEIEWFDLHLQRMLEYLEQIGELANTVVIVTADNGMPFPRAKALCYEYGLHVPMAIMYPRNFPPGRKIDDPVSFVDIAPTILSLTLTSHKGMLPISGKSLVPLLESEKEGVVNPRHPYVFAGRERHSYSRYNNLGYPQRAIRSKNYLLIRNLHPERWPAGQPQRIKPGTDAELLPLYGIDEKGIHHSEWAFTDVDPSPSKSFLAEHHADEKFAGLFTAAFGKYPEFELFDVENDPGCLRNLAGQKAFRSVEKRMKKALLRVLKKSADPRIVGPDKEIFDSYIRYGTTREFPVPAN